jgi:hypothetical protein
MAIFLQLKRAQEMSVVFQLGYIQKSFKRAVVINFRNSKVRPKKRGKVYIEVTRINLHAGLNS